MTVEKNSDEC